MRWILLLASFLALSACSSAENIYLGLAFAGGVGYDVRSTGNSAFPSAYEATAAYSPERVSDQQRSKIAVNLAYRALARLKADGYDYAIVQGPTGVQLHVETKTRYGVVTSSRSYPGMKLRLIGYKATGPRAPDAVPINTTLARLKPETTDI